MGQPNISNWELDPFRKMGQPNISNRELDSFYKNGTTQYIKQGVSAFLEKWDNPKRSKRGLNTF
jgi:hypothetical protein